MISFYKHLVQCSPSFLYLADRALGGPLEVLFTLLIFILSKNPDTTAMHLTALACLKPITSIFAFYISSLIFGRQKSIKRYLILNLIVGCSACLFFPFVHNPWFYIASFAVFMTSWRAAYPAWMEFLKSKIEFSELSVVVARGTSIYYFMNIFFPLLIGSILDIHPEVWRYFYLGFAMIKLCSLIYIFQVDLQGCKAIEKPSFSMLHHFVDPIRKGWSLLREKPAYLHYQILFFLIGAGIIGTQPVLPLFFKNSLGLTYTQLTLAFSTCKGISFILASPYWAKITHRISIYQLNSYVALFTCLFFLMILFSNFNTNYLYIAYLLYGTMQAGCEISWNLSGPLFSGSNESTIYSSINLAAVGIRGCLCPFLGHLLFISTNANIVFAISGMICVIGCIYGLWLDKIFRSHDPLYAK